MSVRDIQTPNDWNPIQKAEFKAYKSALIEIEQEYIQLQNGENIDQKQCIAHLEEIRDKRKSQAKQRLEARIENIEKQYQREQEKIEYEREEYKKLLFDRLIRSYSQSYHTICSQLKDVMGKDYAQYIATKGLNFPILQGSEMQLKSKMSQPEEAKIKLSPSEIEQDLKRINQILEESEKESN